MNIGALLIGLLILLVLLGMPVPMAIGFASMISLHQGHFQIAAMAQKMFSGVDSFVLLAIPYFILAGNIMARGKMTDKIIDFCAAALGWMKGSLAIITVGASAIFAALTGSGVATVSAIGGITIPAMRDSGYDEEFATAVAANAAILGPLIPPSVFLITYGSAAELDISALFKAAAVPGVFMAFSMAVYCVYYAKKHNLKAGERFSVKKTAVALKNGVWALLMPIVLLGVIFMGVCTPTEAAAVACVYTILVACLIYRTVGLKDLFRIFEDSAVAAGAIMFLMGNSKISGYVMAIAKVPGTIASAILSVSDNPVVIMVLINIFLLIVGMFMEGNAAIVILTPILLPIAKLCGMNGIQFGVLMCVNLCMGLVTPPVGGCLHIGTMIANTKIEKVFIKCLPFLLVELLTLALVTSVPAFTLAAAGVK